MTWALVSVRGLRVASVGADRLEALYGLTPQMAAAWERNLANPKRQAKARAAMQENIGSYASRVKLGKRYASLLKKVKPSPSRDTGPFVKAMELAKAEGRLDEFLTGRFIPEGWWEPMRPIEVSVLGDDVFLEDGNHRLYAARKAGGRQVLLKVIPRDEHIGMHYFDAETVIVPL